MTIDYKVGDKVKFNLNDSDDVVVTCRAIFTTADGIEKCVYEWEDGLVGSRNAEDMVKYVREIGVGDFVRYSGGSTAEFQVIFIHQDWCALLRLEAGKSRPYFVHNSVIELTQEAL